MLNYVFLSVPVLFLGLSTSVSLPMLPRSLAARTRWNFPISFQCYCKTLSSKGQIALYSPGWLSVGQSTSPLTFLFSFCVLVLLSDKIFPFFKYFLSFHCCSSFSHPLSTKCFLSQNILLFFLLSCSSLPPTKYFPSPPQQRSKISKRVLHCLPDLFFIQVFNTNHIPFMSALVNYGAVVMLMQVQQFIENSSPSFCSTNT